MTLQISLERMGSSINSVRGSEYTYGKIKFSLFMPDANLNSKWIKSLWEMTKIFLEES